MICALAVQNVPERRGRPSSSSVEASRAFPASNDTSIGATTFFPLPPFPTVITRFLLDNSQLR